MLEKISKAFAVIEKLKTLPQSELEWVLHEAKLAVMNNQMLAKQKVASEDSFQRQLGRQRLHTLQVVSDLLDTVNIS